MGKWEREEGEGGGLINISRVDTGIKIVKESTDNKILVIKSKRGKIKVT